MAKTQYKDLLSLPDVFQSWQYDLIIPNVPGGGSPKALTLKCQQITLPGVQLEPVTVGLAGYELNYAGRQVYTHTSTATFVETVDQSTRDTLLKWSRSARDARRGTGASKSQYTATVDIVLYDDAGNERRRVRLYNAFPEAVDDAQLDGSTSTAVTVNATFRFDDHDDIVGG